MPDIDISIVVPTFNQVRYTAQMFASLARVANGLRYEIIVVDNGSTDETLSFVGSHTPGQLRGRAQGETPPVALRVLHNPVKHALSRSWNMGVEAARSDRIIVTNNDVIYAPGSLQRMIEATWAQQNGVVIPFSPQDVTGAMPQISLPDTTAQIVANLQAVEEWQAKRPMVGENWFVKDPYMKQGGYCFLFRRDVWDKVGKFDEEYDLTGEDYDWFSRALRWTKIVQVPDAYVEHFGKTSCQHLWDDYHQRLGRNRFRLAEKRDGQYEMFSVVIPVYNRADALKSAIDSVIAQTFPHWKIYVIDDGSQDWDRIQELAETYMKGNEAGRIWFFHKPTNEGPGATRNYGLALTRGKYVAFLDSDDVWHPNHLSEHWEVHERHGYEMVYSDPEFAWRWWDKKTQSFLFRRDAHPTIKYWGAFDREKLQEFNYIQTSAVTVWGDNARSIRFTDRRTRPDDIAEDWDYFKQIEGEVYHIPKVTCRYHLSKNAEQSNLMERHVRVQGAQVAEVKQSVRIPHHIHDSVLLGVVIPTCDRAFKLSVALESIGLTDIPVCVVDDASVDTEGVQKVTETFSAASLLRADVRSGPSWARNRGVEYLPCEWIHFLDDDDLFVADWYQRLRPYLTKDYDVVICSALTHCKQTGGLYVEDAFFTSQLTVRKDFFLRAGGFVEALQWAEERDLLSRLEAAGARIKYLKTPLVIRPSHGGSGNPATAPIPASRTTAPRSTRSLL